MQEEQYYMKLALREARKAEKLNEVPIGCVIVQRGRVISQAYNRKTLDNVATYHAEVLAIEQACKNLNTWYLDDCVLYTTVEPCLMCTGAIMQSRISKVVYGVKNDAFGYLSRINNLKFEVISGILKEECGEILTNFFKKRRVKN